MPSARISRLPSLTRPSRWLLGALLAPLLGACSMIELGYSQAPALLANRIDEVFALDDRQQKMLRLRLAEFHDWHRENELARYEEILSLAADKTADGVTADEVIWLVDEVRGARDRLVIRLIDDLAGIGLSLTPEQIAHFRRVRGEDLAEDREERRQSDWRAQLAEQRLERIEDWIGYLDEELEARALARLAQVSDSFDSWSRYREDRDTLLATALAESATVAELKQRTRRTLVDPEVDYRRAFEADRQIYWREYSAAIVDIFGWLPPDRHQRIIDKLRDYARIARSLGT